ncbi:TIR domain-containing protein [Microbispora rosea]|uniref:TIR domain-containing protein n=1 Tax=Microbispora rosea TaxID=58117 RepID=UPI003D8D20AB
MDVLIVVALQEEYDAARAVGSAYGAAGLAQWQKHDQDASTPYETIEITSAAGPTLSVALARPTRMGGRAIGPFTTALTERLAPQCVAMCGVCAGNPSVVALGDVVVAELVYEYDEGKRTATHFLGDHRQFPMNDGWVRAAQKFSPAGLPSYGRATREEATLWFLERLLAGDEPRDHPARARYFPNRSWRTWPADMQTEGLIVRSDQGWALTDEGRSFVGRRLYDDVDGPDRLPFAVQVAPMASGNGVAKDGMTWAQLSQMGVRTVAALEMEAATVATVARQQQVPHWLVVKGAMDHADPRKDDRYKTFAARASAEVLYALLTRLLAPAATRQPASDSGTGVVAGQSGTTEKSASDPARIALAAPDLIGLADDGSHAEVGRRDAVPDSSPILLSWAAQDEEQARWAYEELTAAGYDVLLKLPQGDTRTHELRKHVDDGGRVFSFVSPAYLRDEDRLIDRDYPFYLDPASAPHRLVPVLIDGEPEGLLALLPFVDLRGTVRSEAKRRLLDAAARPPVTFGDRRATGKPPAVEFKPGDPLPRLQRLSDRARRSAGAVPGTNFADAEQNQFASGLYVTRDLEEKLSRQLRVAPDIPLVVVGEPGSGKTSILWGMARRLCEAPGGEVFFVKATWLAADGTGGGTRVDEVLLTAAIEAARQTGRTVTLLIDTVDVLVNNDESWTTLVTVVETAVGAGASVVMTSRVAEATELPVKWTRCRLWDYATGGPSEAQSMGSEFARAVAVHSRFFTNDPRMRENLVNQMLGVVARDLSLKPLCLRPLTLRMLFEIYAPGQVSEVVDPTGLYEAYWDNRVLQDRRVWDSTADRGDSDRDLSEAVKLLALEMLRTGLPEVNIGTLALPASMTSRRLNEEIDLLVRRGVGQRADNGVFQFFHQTFFEYAASRALVFDHGKAGIDALIARAEEQHDDYFLLAVLEQTLLCAGKAQDSTGHAADAIHRLLLRFAKEVENDGKAARYGLRRVILAVCAQSPLLRDDIVSSLTAILASPRFELPALRGFLQLLPAPGRRFGRHDLAFLGAAAGRKDNAWLAVIDVLVRLLPRDSPSVITAVRRLRFVERAVEGDRELAHRGELRDFLVSLLLWEPAETLPLLGSVVEAALVNGKTDYVALVFAKMAELCAANPDVGDWANRLLGSTTVESSQLVKNHAALLIPRLRRLGFDELLTLFRDLAERLTSGTIPITADRSLLGAVLTIAGELCPPDADVRPFLASFTQVTYREMVSDLCRGWLVPLLDSTSPVGEATRDLAVDWLVTGMPTTTEESIDDTRAKVVRTTLTRLDLPLHRAADVAARAVTGWSRAQDEDSVTAWTDTNCLLHLVIRGAAAGIPEARTAVERLRDGRVLRSPDIVALVDPFRVHAGTEQETVLLLNLLLSIGESHRTLLLLEHGRELNDVTIARLRESALAEFRSAMPAERPTKLRHQARARLRNLAKLLARLDALSDGLHVAWPELVGWLDLVMDVEATGYLIELLGAGLERGEYSSTEVLSQLRALCGAEENGALDCSSAQAHAARLWCVWWYANYGTVEHVPELFRLAFARPVDPIALIKASSYIYASRRPTPLTVEQCADLLLDMGRRLKDCGLGSARRKDVAHAWTSAMWSFVPGSGTSVQLRLVQALADLDDPFAGNLVQYVSPSRRPEVLDGLQAVAATPGIGTRLKRNINDVLDRHRRHSSDSGWPGLFKDLKKF